MERTTTLPRVVSSTTPSATMATIARSRPVDGHNSGEASITGMVQCAGVTHERNRRWVGVNRQPEAAAFEFCQGRVRIWRRFPHTANGSPVGAGENSIEPLRPITVPGERTASPS